MGRVGDEANEHLAYKKAITLATESLTINQADWESMGLMSLYYFASLGSLAIGDYATALTHLESAVNNGFSTDLIVNDPDLKELEKHDPGKFQAVLVTEN